MLAVQHDDDDDDDLFPMQSPINKYKTTTVFIKDIHQFLFLSIYLSDSLSMIERRKVLSFMQ